MADGYPHGRCTATAKTTGERCLRPAQPGFTVCRFHGGATPVGAASPHFKHGEFSKHMPLGILKGFSESMADPDQLDLRRDVGLLDGVLIELLEGMKDAPDAAASWDQMRKLLTALEAILSNPTDENTKKLPSLVRQMWGVTNTASRYHQARREMTQVLEQKRKTVADLTRVETSRDRVFTVAEVATMISAFVELVRSISDEQERRFVLTRMQQIVSLEDGHE